jgi:hypothetical protein
LWIFKPDWRSVYGINRFSLKGGEGIGKSCMYSVTVMTTKLIGVHQSKWRSASSIVRITVSKRFSLQQSCSQTAYGIEMCYYLRKKFSQEIRLFFNRLPLQQESGA